MNNKNSAITGTLYMQYNRISNEQLQPFYDTVLQLMELLNQLNYGYGYGDNSYLLHIDCGVHKLATSLKAYIERHNTQHICFSGEYKYRLPLLTIEQYSLLKQLINGIDDNELTNLISDSDCVYDFSNELKPLNKQLSIFKRLKRRISVFPS